MKSVANILEEQVKNPAYFRAEDWVEACALHLEHEDARMDRRLQALTTLGWWALILSLALTAMGCAPRNTRSIVESHESSVRITVTCLVGAGNMLTVAQGYGSGVIVGEHSILTAHHVANSENARAGCLYNVTTADGQSILAAPNREWKEHDVSELVTIEPLPFTPVRLADAPGAGERACIVSAYPRWYRRCGEINYYRDDAPGDVGIDTLVEPGNSGSGVYDTRGRLVGIATHLYRCQNGQWCGGKFSSLDFLGGKL